MFQGWQDWLVWGAVALSVGVCLLWTILTPACDWPDDDHTQQSQDDGSTHWEEASRGN